MKNQNTNTMTEGKTIAEILEILMRPKTPEEVEAQRLEDQKHFNELHNEFLEQHDWSEAPTLQTKQAAAWTRNNILLDSWNQFINCEAKQAEFFGLHPEGKGFRVLNDTRRCDIALNFAHYFLASIEAQVKWIDEEEAKENETKQKSIV